MSAGKIVPIAGLAAIALLVGFSGTSKAATPTPPTPPTPPGPPPVVPPVVPPPVVPPPVVVDTTPPKPVTPPPPKTGEKYTDANGAIWSIYDTADGAGYYGVIVGGPPHPAYGSGSAGPTSTKAQLVNQIDYIAAQAAPYLGS